MSRYQHTKGQIKDNAIEALLHDPLFRQEASGKQANRFFTTGLLLSLLIKNACFVLSADREFRSAVLLL